MQIRAPWFVSCSSFVPDSFGRITPNPALTFVVALFLINLPLHGQQNPLTQIIGNADQGIVLPQSAPFSERQDSAALAEIHAYRNAINLGSWADMQGAGELTSTAIDSTGGSAPESATLWIRNHHGYRLDVQKPKGMSSLRMDGAYGTIQHADGQMKSIDSRDAVAGLLAFPALMESGFPTPSVMLIDQGTATVDGTALHRITVERPWPGGPVDSQGSPLTTITDLYFNPQTHLLMKSANGVLGSKTGSVRLLRVITYGDYQAENGMLIPASYRETLNGQILWTLQLTQVQLNQGLSEAEFHF